MKQFKTEEIYSKKLMLVEALVDLNKRKITDDDASAMGTKLGLSSQSSKLTWNNFVQTGGKIDLRVKNGSYRGVAQFGNRKSRGAKTNSSITSAEAGKLLKKAMHSSAPVGEFCLNHKISVAQYYSWLKELNISGTLLKRRVLNPTKYAKLDVKLAIWMSKHPNSSKKEIKQLNKPQRKAYTRLTQVLEKYL